MRRYLTPYQRERRFERRFTIAVAITVALLALAVLDRWAFQTLYVAAGLGPEAAYGARERLGDRDWYEFLRAVGYLPTWIVVGLAMMVAAGGRWPKRQRAQGLNKDEAGGRSAQGHMAQQHMAQWHDGAQGAAADGVDGLLGLRVILSAAIAGGIADVLKPLVGRVRPMFTDGLYYWHRVPEGLTAEQISHGLPSSHAAVAFGAAWALAMAWPRVGWVVLPLAAGCGLTRMLAGAHFLTDVAVAAVLAYAVARLLRRGGWRGE